MLVYKPCYFLLHTPEMIQEDFVQIRGKIFQHFAVQVSGSHLIQHTIVLQTEAVAVSEFILKRIVSAIQIDGCHKIPLKGIPDALADKTGMCCPLVVFVERRFCFSGKKTAGSPAFFLELFYVPDDLLHMGTQDQSQPGAVFKVIQHLHMVGTEAGFISCEADIIFHVARSHGEGDFFFIQFLFHGTDRTFSRVVKDVVDRYFI